VLISTQFLATTPACTRRFDGGGNDFRPHLSFSLEDADLVSRAMKPRIRVETAYTSYTLHKTASRFFVLGWELGSELPGSGLALSWQVVVKV